jgi:hypothetical protein
MQTTITTNAEFEDSLKRWIRVDTQIKLANQQMRELRSQRDILSNDVCDFIEKNRMEKRKIETPDSKIEYYERKEYSALSYAFLEKHLADIIPDEKNVKYIMEYLRSKREIKKSHDLKRVFNKGMKKGTMKEYGGNESE